jgi:hypothetical protein
MVQSRNSLSLKVEPCKELATVLWLNFDNLDDDSAMV